jgi:hypothetical protein
MRREKIRPGDTFGAYGSKHKGVITEVKDGAIKFEVALKCGVLITGSMAEDFFREAYTTIKPIKQVKQVNTNKQAKVV